MKRILALVLSMLMVLCLFSGCGKDEKDPSAPDVNGAGLNQNEVVSGPINPLTGEKVSEDKSDLRPYCVMINNHPDARPCVGLSQASIIYEALAEGGITRMMAVFNNVDGITVGSLRSARPYYISMAQAYDAIYIHAGGSEQAYSDIKSLGIDNIDGVRGARSGEARGGGEARRGEERRGRRRAAHGGRIVMPVPPGSTMQNDLLQIFNGMTGADRAPETQLSQWIYRALCDLLVPPPPRDWGTAGTPVGDTVLYILNHLQDELTVPALAERVALSPAHFSRLFKQSTGYSPHEFLVLRRIDEAKNLLQTTGLSVKEIAFRTGYRSEVNFIASFLSKVGVSPAAFRKTRH